MALTHKYLQGLWSGHIENYVFYVNESIQICMISGKTLPVKADCNHVRRHD